MLCHSAKSDICNWNDWSVDCGDHWYIFKKSETLSPGFG